MPRRSAHPLSTLLRAFGWQGAPDESETLIGDTIQPIVEGDGYDPAFTTFGFSVSFTPIALNHGIVTVFFDRDVLAYRVRGLGTARTSVGGNGAKMRTTTIPETADPLSTIEPMYKSRAVETPFRARERSALPAAALPLAGWNFGGFFTTYRGDQIFNNPVWTDGALALEIVEGTVAEALEFHLMIDVLRA